MSINEEYSLDRTLSKKQFLEAILNALEKRNLAHNAFGFKFGTVSFEEREALLVKGSADLDYVCSVSKPTEEDPENQVPMMGNVSGETEVLLNLGKPLGKNYEEFILQMTSVHQPMASSRALTEEQQRWCAQAIKEKVFQEQFRQGNGVQSVSFTGEPEIESITLIRVPYLTCTLNFPDDKIEVMAPAFLGVPPTFVGIEHLPTANQENGDLLAETKRMKDPPKAMTLLIIIPFMMFFFGFYLMIQNMGRDNTWFFIFMGIAGAGLLGIIIFAIILLRRKAKGTAFEEKTRADWEIEKQQELKRLRRSIDFIPDV